MSYEAAKQRANEIARLDLGGNMFTTVSLGCEYCNSYDVEADMNPPTVTELSKAIQKRLNELGYHLAEDGFLGPRTLAAILAALNQPRTTS